MNRPIQVKIIAFILWFLGGIDIILGIVAMFFIKELLWITFLRGLISILLGVGMWKMRKRVWLLILGYTLILLVNSIWHVSKDIFQGKIARGIGDIIPGIMAFILFWLLKSGAVGNALGIKDE